MNNNLKVLFRSIGVILIPIYILALIGGENPISIVINIISCLFIIFAKL